LSGAGSERFDLSYIGDDGAKHRPYIIHRAPLGTHERFLAFLIEHFGGAFPTWMAPLQVKIVPVADKFPDYVERLQRELHGMMVRVEVDHTSETFNKKIRNAVTKKTPNILVIGGREAENEEITWRRYASKEQRTLKFTEFKSILARMIEQRTMDNFADEAIPS
jgi:threonyl-tRNA synthetase